MESNAYDIIILGQKSNSESNRMLKFECIKFGIKCQILEEVIERKIRGLKALVYFYNTISATHSDVSSLKWLFKLDNSPKIAIVQSGDYKTICECLEMGFNDVLIAPFNSMTVQQMLSYHYPGKRLFIAS